MAQVTPVASTGMAPGCLANPRYGSPDLYASIQMSNPLTDKVTEAFVQAAAAHRDALAANDHDAVTALFDRVREFFGDFTDRALEQSSHMIDRLVERM